jgi:hypothetical protein
VGDFLTLGVFQLGKIDALHLDFAGAGIYYASVAGHRNDFLRVEGEFGDSQNVISSIPRFKRRREISRAGVAKQTCHPELVKDLIMFAQFVLA